MRSAFIRTLLFGCLCALASLAQQQLSVDKLVDEKGHPSEAGKPLLAKFLEAFARWIERNATAA